MRSRFKTRLLIASLIVARALAASQAILAQAGATLNGAVTDTNGLVVVDASVSLYSKYGTAQTKSDWMGQFQFTNLLPGTYKVVAEHKWFQTVVIQPIHIKGESLSPLSITLKMGAVVMGNCGDSSSVSYEERASGHVQLTGAMQPMPPAPEPNVDWPWTPFSGATVKILKAGSNQVVASMHPDNRGRFQFSDLALGEYTLAVTYVGYYDARSAKFQITSEDMTTVTVTMIPQGQPVVCM